MGTSLKTGTGPREHGDGTKPSETGAERPRHLAVGQERQPWPGPPGGQPPATPGKGLGRLPAPPPPAPLPPLRLGWGFVTSRRHHLMFGLVAKNLKQLFAFTCRKRVSGWPSPRLPQPDLRQDPGGHLLNPCLLSQRSQTTEQLNPTAPENIWGRGPASAGGRAKPDAAPGPPVSVMPNAEGIAGISLATYESQD